MVEVQGLIRHFVLTFVKRKKEKNLSVATVYRREAKRTENKSHQVTAAVSSCSRHCNM